MNQEKLSRRSFLKGAAIAGVSGALTTSLLGCDGDDSPGAGPTSGNNIDWAMEADVVVLGAGAGGLCAATAAARKGAQVLIIEKAPQSDTGGNTRVSGNMWTTATNPDAGLKYYLAASEKIDMKEYLTALVNDGYAKLNDEWLPTFPDMKVSLLPIFSPEFHALPGNEVIQAWCNEGTGESQLWLSLQAGTEEEQNVEIAYDTPGKRLITDNAGMIIGVVAEQNGAEINIKAKKAVILATGGYEFNKYLIENSYPGWPVFSRGTPYNTGDGILMAQKVGAQLWHMNASDSGVGAIKVPGLNYGNGLYDSDDVPANFALGVASAMGNKGYIAVDKYGKRFMPEDREDGHGYGRREYLFWYDGVKCEWPRLPFWTIFDGATAQSPVVMPVPGGGFMSQFTWFAAFSGYEWSADNSAEVERGWILKADTIEELAQKMTAKQADERKELNRPGVVVEPDVLAKTLADYNSFATSGLDTELGRAAATMVPLEGPFYAVQVYPNQYNTQGGPKRNTKAQTLDAFDEPIPHLYNVGECGAGYAWVYNGGWNIAEAMITGFWAGENSVEETAWDE